MAPTHQGSIRLFRAFGITVSLHWSWFLLAAWAMDRRVGYYSSPVWNLVEYVALFAIVLMHEFGHSLACRQVGGQAEQIVLWPLGGVAYVRPPQRPGATLWSIAAGPLVNVVLLPVLFGLHIFGQQQGWSNEAPDTMRLLFSLAWINLFLLAFNVLPIYPLDGGQILQSLLWFVVGRARSLQIATIIGFVGSGLLLAYAIWQKSIWIGIMAVFLGQRCMLSFQQAKGLFTLDRMPRHTGFACPSCHQAPPGGPHWICRQCRGRFDPFSTRAVCPHCQAAQATTTCPHCGTESPIERWVEAGRVSGGFRS